ncbi:MAG: hypothetical protein D8M58_18495 [Calditrichaeota bacterium]|nr:MAG: hypothetical protein DWQ03_11725 [Calditrichota bacterium]MBL1207400.1 hypothetical protein [Calditrichota bacterium]NOG47232.1 hypothetical protein [Calditrichota bacterium]
MKTWPELRFPVDYTKAVWKPESWPAENEASEMPAFISHYINQLAGHCSSMSLLSVSSGELKEIASIHPCTIKKIENYYAVDGNPKNLRNINLDFPGAEIIKIVHASICSLVHINMGLPQMDLIYSIKNINYINTPIAKYFIKVCFDLLKVSGKIIIANFVPSFLQQDYMSVFADWKPCFRVGQSLDQLLGHLGSDKYSMNSFWDAAGNRFYLEITKTN